MTDQREDRSAPRDMSVAGILERWTDGALSTPQAIELGQFDGFADLLQATIDSNVPLRRKLLPHEVEQARRFTALLQQCL